MAQSKYPGIYKVKGGNLRGLDRKVIAALRQNDEVRVKKNAPGESRFGTGPGGLGAKEHTWVMVTRSELVGWVVDENLGEECPMPPTPVGQSWRCGNLSVIIPQSCKAAYVGQYSKDVASIQTAYSPDRSCLTVSGIGAEARYPGLGSLLILLKLERTKATNLQISNMVGSFGFWKKLGAKIDDSLVFNTVGMTREKIDAENKRRYLALALKNSSHVPGTQTVSAEQAIEYLRLKTSNWELET